MPGIQGNLSHPHDRSFAVPFIFERVLNKKGREMGVLVGVYTVPESGVFYGKYNSCNTPLTHLKYSFD